MCCEMMEEGCNNVYKGGAVAVVRRGARGGEDPVVRDGRKRAMAKKMGGGGALPSGWHLGTRTDSDSLSAAEDGQDLSEFL